MGLAIYLDSEKINIFDPVSKEMFISGVYKRPFWVIELEINKSNSNSKNLSTMVNRKIIANIAEEESLRKRCITHNCMVTTDNSQMQTVHYLPPINFSPTSYAIVNKTLIMANEIAGKSNEELIIVTYDLQLAITKMAIQIQQNEKPKYDNIFINSGAFHTQMAFFKAIGKYIDCSGLVDVLVQAQVLTGGSTSSL